MGYLGVLNFNSIQRTEKKFCGDTFMAYAKMYAQSKPCLITKSAVYHAKQDFHSCPYMSYANTALCMSSLSSIIGTLGNFIGYFLYCDDYFTMQGEYIGTKRIYATSLENRMYFLSENESKRLEVKGFTEEDLSDDDKIKYIPKEKTDALKCLSYSISLNALKMSMASKAEYLEVKTALLKAKSRNDFMSVISLLSERLNALMEDYTLYFNSTKKIMSALDQVLELIENGENVYVVKDGAFVLIQNEKLEQLFKLYYPSLYPFSSLFESAGVSKFDCTIEIMDYSEMERFIGLFGKIKERNHELEELIVTEYDYCKQHDLPIKMVLGGGY